MRWQGPDAAAGLIAVGKSEQHRKAHRAGPFGNFFQKFAAMEIRHATIWRGANGRPGHDEPSERSGIG